MMIIGTEVMTVIMMVVTVVTVVMVVMVIMQVITMMMITGMEVMTVMMMMVMILSSYPDNRLGWNYLFLRRKGFSEITEHIKINVME